MTLKPEDSTVLLFEADTSALRQTITTFGSLKTIVSGVNFSYFLGYFKSVAFWMIRTVGWYVEIVTDSLRILKAHPLSLKIF